MFGLRPNSRRAPDPPAPSCSHRAVQRAGSFTPFIRAFHPLSPTYRLASLSAQLSSVPTNLPPSLLHNTSASPRTFALLPSAPRDPLPETLSQRPVNIPCHALPLSITSPHYCPEFPNLQFPSPSTHFLHHEFPFQRNSLQSQDLGSFKATGSIISKEHPRCNPRFFSSRWPGIRAIHQPKRRLKRYCLD